MSTRLAFFSEQTDVAEDTTTLQLGWILIVDLDFSTIRDVTSSGVDDDIKTRLKGGDITHNISVCSLMTFDRTYF